MHMSVFDSHSSVARVITLVAALGALGAAVLPAGCGGASREVFDGEDATGSTGVTPIPGEDPGVIGADGGGGCQSLQCQVVACEDGGPTTTVTGTVYEPSGKIPLYNAIVYVPINPELAPITPGASCDRCGTPTVKTVTSTLTDIKGEFKLENVPVGADIPVVVQVGKWRKVVHMKVDACTVNPMAEKFTLPKNQQEGSIPRIAVNVGSEDPLACLLTRIGIDDAEFTAPGGTGAIQIFAGNGYSFGGPKVQGDKAPKAKDALYDSAEHLAQYDVVLMACEGAPYNQGDPVVGGDKTPEDKVRMRDYLNAGGRVFATHYHATWFKDGPDDVKSVASWGGSGPATDTSGTFSIDRTFPKGEAFGDWLQENANSNGTTIHLDEFGDSIDAANEKSQRWIYNDQSHPVKYLSFNTPVDVAAEEQCGRAVISDVHVGNGGGSDSDVPGGCSNAPLSDQEKALLFLLMDLSSCVQDDKVVPTAPN